MENTTHSRSNHAIITVYVVIGLIVISILTAAAFLFKNNRPVAVTIPTHAVPKDNGLDFFIRASKMPGKPGPVSDPNGDKWTMADYEAFMVANKPAFEEVRRGLNKPCVTPPFRGSDFTMLFPDNARLRELARTLRGAATYYEKKGDYGNAVECQLDAVEIGASMPNGGCMIQDLVAIAVAAIGSHKIEPSVSKLNPAQLEVVARRLEHIRSDMVPYDRIVLEEGYSNASSWCEILSSPETRSELSNPLKWAENCSSYTNKAPRSQIECFYRGGKLALSYKPAIIRQILDYYNKMSVEVRKPYDSKVALPAFPNDIDFLCSPDIIEGGWKAHLRAETNILLIQTEIAIRRYKADSGRYPAKLDDIAPKYLKSVPVDLFGLGNPLVYRLTKGGRDFVLYSIGPNQIDDGGAADKRDYRNGDLLLEK